MMLGVTGYSTTRQPLLSQTVEYFLVFTNPICIIFFFTTGETITHRKREEDISIKSNKTIKTAGNYFNGGGHTTSKYFS